ncbi:putative glycosyltransferase [Halobacteroides halobius DSM 5150]|uniref:Putative glycosyltransferase n=1 Tax=Halobacteroides halobius (strain ATCC 35273 / DSM 5150 / MD-1) TaxID=748449 RepID=L0KCL2_HALHC|nr:glycosyltransferase [Halobacteroides halobius]AGB42129.1 putative glycosyltransferase [Halobacteroides halobius DSM 5150]
MPKVSVIIPSYNHEKYIAEAINSVLNQTFQDFELIIVDDGSNDNSVEVIKSFTDSRIDLFCFKENQGASVVVNKCIDRARGKYIAILNSDDIFVLDKLEKQVQFLDKYSEIGAVFSYVELIDETGKQFKDESHDYYKTFNQKNRTRFEWLNYFFNHGNCLCHPSVLIRKECYNTIGYYDERLAQLPDFDFWVRLCMKYNIYIMPEQLIKFRIRDDEKNISANTPQNKIRSSWELPKILKNFLDINSDDILKIFPGLREDIDYIDDDITPFLIAKLALEKKDPSYKSFGLNTLYKMLGNKVIYNKLNEKYEFTYADFLKLTVKYDLFSITHNLSELDLNIKKELLKDVIKDKKIFIWGSGDGGIKTLNYLQGLGIDINGLIDISPNKQGKKINDIYIYEPSILEEDKFKRDSYVIIGSSYVQEIESNLRCLGYRWIDDYITPIIKF